MPIIMINLFANFLQHEGVSHGLQLILIQKFIMDTNTPVATIVKQVENFSK